MQWGLVMKLRWILKLQCQFSMKEVSILKYIGKYFSCRQEFQKCTCIICLSVFAKIVQSYPFHLCGSRSLSLAYKSIPEHRRMLSSERVVTERNYSILSLVKVCKIVDWKNIFHFILLFQREVKRNGLKNHDEKTYFFCVLTDNQCKG